MEEQRLAELGIVLPTKDLKGKGLISVREHENLLFVSGQGPLDEQGKPVYTGKLGQDLTLEEGYQAARLCGMHLLARVREYVGDLGRVDQIIKLLGLVACTPDFYDHPQVMNGCSDLLVDVLNQRGQHARSAMGTLVLPMNIPVEVEMIVSIRR